MTRQVPRGSPDLVCPFHKKAMEEVCHKCPMWYEIAQRTPQGEETRVWDCALSFGPTMLQYMIREQKQTVAGLNKLVTAVEQPMIVSPSDIRHIIDAKD